MKVELDPTDKLVFHIVRSTLYQWEADFRNKWLTMPVYKAEMAGYIFRMKEMFPEYVAPKLHHHAFRMNLWKRNTCTT